MNKISFKQEIKDFNNQSFTEMIVDNKEYIYPILIYIAGLLLGSFLLSYSNSLTEIMRSVFEINQNGFSALFVNRLSVYMSVYAITILLGLCLIGFPFIHIIPFICGVEIAMKTAYYYVNFSIKGIGYSLLLIIPESAAFITIVIFTIKCASILSKQIYSATIKKSDMAVETDFKSYLRNFLIYALIIVLIALVNALLTYLLSAIIKI